MTDIPDKAVDAAYAVVQRSFQSEPWEFGVPRKTVRAALAAASPFMGAAGLPELRAANEARQKELDAGGGITLTFRATELAGEVGEACNVAKKLERERLGLRGSRATVAQLAEELADVVICADLVALGEGIDLDAAVVAKFNATSEKNGLSTRIRSAPVPQEAEPTLAELTTPQGPEFFARYAAAVPQDAPAEPVGLCSDCPPVGYPDRTRCLPCPRCPVPAAEPAPALVAEPGGAADLLAALQNALEATAEPVAPCNLPDPSASDCKNMKEVGGGFEGERYRCAVCGKGYFLDYEDMK